MEDLYTQYESYSEDQDYGLGAALEYAKIKPTLYTTAQSTVSTADFQAGEFVSLKHYGLANGKHWYICNGGPCLPEDHLTRFCI